jgi:hypothetical protein
VLTASVLQSARFGTEGQVTVPIDFPGAWIVTNQTVTPNGHQFNLLAAPQCTNLSMPETGDCLAKQNLRQIVTYQPANRFWEFQEIETAILLTATALLAAGVVLWIRNLRLT